MSRVSRKHLAGFTLIELMIVVALLAIITGIALASTHSLLRRTRDAKRTSDIAAIRMALELYYQDYDRYPSSQNAGAISPNGQWCVSNDASWNVLTTALKPYISKLPMDPLKGTEGQWVGPPDFDTGYGYFSGQPQGSSDPGPCITSLLWQREYMLVYALEDMSRASSPGVKLCDGHYYNYGGTITVGELKW